ncbi:MAG: hypothetical protein AAGB07_00010 [Pseudomonadota bacterium]
MNRKSKLRVPLIYGLYWSVACMFLGVLIAPVLTPDGGKQSSNGGHGHAEIHSTVEVDPNNAPEVSIRVEKDKLTGWNVYLTVDRFRFTPERVNQTNIRNEGHAHLYLNGQKVTRLYATAFHIADMPQGENVVSVSLNANDHSDLVLDGAPIGAEAVILVGDER